MTRLTLERLLNRLRSSGYAERFQLQDALGFNLLFDVTHRPTRDADPFWFVPA
jgi:hypothetical protein